MPVKLLCFAVLVSLAIAPTAAAQQAGRCDNPEATAAFQEGFDLQRDKETRSAVRSYNRCLDIEPDCIPCNYELGWSYWTQEAWLDVVRQWETVLDLDPNHADARKWVEQARDKAGLSRSTSAPRPRSQRTRDSDKDGIGDQQDQCPEQPEDRDGWDDQDGCPESDNDRDGFPDEEDLCPDRAEDAEAEAARE